jgi:hypothetical protein
MGNGGETPCILNLVIRQVNSHLYSQTALAPGKKGLSTLLIGFWAAPRTNLDSVKKDDTLLLPRMEPEFLSCEMKEVCP